MSRIVFTSCSRYEAFPCQPVWGEIANAYPDYLLLLGDQIYMDYGLYPTHSEPIGSPRKLGAAEFARRMEAKYERQWKETHFVQLRLRMGGFPGVPEHRPDEELRARNRIWGVWDDHDFAWNNVYGGDHAGDPASQAKFNASRALFHRYFYGRPNASSRPIYDWFDLAPRLPGMSSMGRVILLDNRSDATDPKGQSPRLLSEAQWSFLKDRLRHDLPYTLICSGLSLTKDAENWSLWPGEYTRFAKLIRQRKGGSAGVMFLAGDIHTNDFQEPGPRRPCHEIVSSGVNIDYLGFNIPAFNFHNWGMLDLRPEGVIVTLNTKDGSKIHQIPRA